MTAAPPQPALTVFDRADLLRRLGGDLELAKDIIKLFLDDAPAQVAKLRAAVLRSDAAEVSSTGHRIRGAAANLGGRRLRAAVEALERAPESAGQEGRVALLQSVEREFDLLEVAMLEEWIAAPRPGRAT